MACVCGEGREGGGREREGREREEGGVEPKPCAHFAWCVFAVTNGTKLVANDGDDKPVVSAFRRITHK